MIKYPKDSMKYTTEIAFQEAIKKLENAISISKMKIVSRINAQDNLKKIGEQIGGNQIFELFNPKLAKKVFEKNLEAGIIPPVRVYIYEENNYAVCLYNPSEPLFAKFGLGEIGKEVDEAIASILEEAFKEKLEK
jgi:uncharacterized protein (DUF302 family)